MTGDGGPALVLVGTPLGNLGDLSPRAVDALAAADVVACEDTRRTRALLSAAGVTGKRLVAVHALNEAGRAGELTRLLDEGRRVALVSDAGMPGVSDPGRRVVAAAVEAGHRVGVVPGPSAALAALVVSGLPTDRFAFEGFLPRKGGARRRRLTELAAERRTVVLYEAPHRLVVTVEDLAGACGAGRPVALARELTKVHEEVWRGTLGQAGEHLRATPPRGEFVVVLGGAPAAAGATDADIEDALATRLAAGEDRRSAVAAVAAELDVAKRRVYDVALRVAGAGAADPGGGGGTAGP